MLEDSHAFSGFSVNDLLAAKLFYEQKLGLQLIELPGMGLQLQLAGNSTVFIYEKPDHQAANFTILNFPVTAIDSVVAALAGRGVVFERYDSVYQDDKAISRGKAAQRGPDIAWFKDPAGNILSVLEN